LKVLGTEIFDESVICTRTNGCNVNWGKYADQEPSRVLIQDRTSTRPQEVTHGVYSLNGVSRATMSFDSTGIIRSSLESLHALAKNTGKAQAQFIILGGVNGSVFFEKSNQFSSGDHSVLEPRDVYLNYQKTWRSLISRPKYEGFFTLIYLIADPYSGHPIWTQQRIPIAELGQNVLQSQQLPSNTPNKVWAMKITNNMADGQPTVFLYDPGVDGN
ncbi:MAG: hypothetical protein ACK5V3_10565, partial [Bdellovibrionales bacterium]